MHTTDKQVRLHMIANMKNWFWYDWMIAALRTTWLLIIVIGGITHPEMRTAQLWAVLTMAILVYIVPLVVQYKKETWYPAFEVAMAGLFHMYVAYAAPQLIWIFVLFTMIIGLGSSHRTYVWVGILCGFIFPSLNSWLANKPPFEMMFSCSVGFMIGFAFRILMQSHKQAQIIQEQKQLLGQQLAKIEELTLIEERNRLSQELHGMIGNSLTSLVDGVEFLRTSVPESEHDRINALVAIAQRSLDEIRKQQYQLSQSTYSHSISSRLQQFTEEFIKLTSVTVAFRVIGSEVPLMQQMNDCLYRCLQELLTNSVHHRRASNVSVQLYFDGQQIRLQVEDNGAGMAMLQSGSGLHRMEERLLLLQGTLTVHSELEQGTVVICQMPIQAETAQNGIRLLIVDDHTIIADSLQHIFDQHADFTVVGTAVDGQEALEACERLIPDIVLMDTPIQGMNEIETLLEMKLRWPNMKVVFMTTFEDTIQAAAALEHGADGYMLKSSREMSAAMKLVFLGGTWIDQSIAARVFKEMKQQREQLEKISPNDPYGLTKREQEILGHLCSGLRYKAIAVKMYLSEGTVRNYCSMLYAKLGVSRREEAIELARAEKIV